MANNYNITRWRCVSHAVGIRRQNEKWFVLVSIAFFRAACSSRALFAAFACVEVPMLDTTGYMLCTGATGSNLQGYDRSGMQTRKHMHWHDGLAKRREKASCTPVCYGTYVSPTPSMVLC